MSNAIEAINKIEGVLKTYWTGSVLTVYYDELVSREMVKVRVCRYFADRQLQDSVKQYVFISAPKGTF